VGVLGIDSIWLIILDFMVVIKEINGWEGVEFGERESYRI
jgi:hypothetical protein